MPIWNGASYNTPPVATATTAPPTATGPVAPNTAIAPAVPEIPPEQLAALAQQQRAAFLQAHPGQTAAADTYFTPERVAMNARNTGWAHSAATDQTQTPQAVRQAQIYAAQGGPNVYNGNDLTQIPLAVRQAQIYAAQGGPNVYNGNDLTQIPWAVRQAQTDAAQGGPNTYNGAGTTTAGQAYRQAFTPSQAQLAAMQADPRLAQAYVNRANAGYAQVQAAQRAQDAQIYRQQAQRTADMNTDDSAFALPIIGAVMGNPMGLINMGLKG